MRTPDTDMWSVWVALQQTDGAASETLSSALAGQRLVVTSTGVKAGGEDPPPAVQAVPGATALARINDMNDEALGTNLASPYQRLIRWGGGGGAGHPV